MDPADSEPKISEQRSTTHSGGPAGLPPQPAARWSGDFHARLLAATPRTYFSHLLLAANVVVFAAMTLSGANLLAPSGESLLAGLCGSVVSLAWNPVVVSAGASGALFGIFGALLACLILLRREIPPAPSAGSGRA
jgi:asparagine N-glycosylation enzyme membrane subunit Stt3